MRARCIAAVVAALVLTALVASQIRTDAAATYLVPPKVIVDILDAPPLPTATVSPTRDVVALLERRSMPSIEELAQPMYRLAGYRVNPRTNGPQRPSTLIGITLERLGTGASTAVTTPANSTLGCVEFSPDGKMLAFTATREKGIELWIADPTTGRARAVTSPALNGAAGAPFGNRGAPCAWLDDSRALLCRFVVDGRGAPPAEPDVPAGPNVQENLGKTAPVRTYEDLLQNAHDEALYEYYFTSQLALVDAASGQKTPVGRPAIFDEVSASPSGEFILVERIKRPFSYLVPAGDFPRSVEVWNRQGEVVKTIADLPLADVVPIGGVLPGPRAYEWKATEPATLVWAEALDGGNPRAAAPFRDRIMTTRAPFAGDPVELLKTEYRFTGVTWTDKGSAIVTEYDRPKRWRRTWLLDATMGGEKRLVWDRSAEDRYGDPGRPVTRPGSSTILQSGTAIYLTGDGASPEGDRPFLDRLDLRTLESTRLFRTDDKTYETVVGLLADDGSSVLTRRESPSDPPNYYVRTIPSGSLKAVTAFTDPAPALRGITKELVTYDRADGVKLSGTIYLPPGYTPGTRLPMFVWAYPREFTDPDAASQVIGSASRFTTISGPSHLLMLTQGYAIFDGPTMPIIGKGETANDTYVEQLVASAQAAVDKAVEMGIADRDRVGVGGHSYGAFMTANLLAHSDIFRAGIARSGAYNRTLTPFGFQNEMRTFWEAKDVYAKMSPFFYADKINEPILLIHGEADDNSGTFPIQSERLYMALKGHGATVRYVTLPDEAHGYVARESVLDTVAEMLNWLDTYVKHAKPRETTPAGR
jgi:dipeptidyl aminopeptidase/acylaminoacyl peptidase